MDPITDVFTAMHVENVFQGRLEATAPWGVRCTSAEPHASFAMVLRGNCWLTLDGVKDDIPLAGGDCILVPRGSGQIMRDHPHTRPRDIREVIGGDCATCKSGVVHFGGGGAPTSLLAGKFTFDMTTSKPLLQLLPPVIHIRGDQPQSAALQSTLQLLASETAAGGFGSRVVINRLADIFFIQALRVHCASADCRKRGWLRALSDPQIGAALNAMHDKVDQQWTVESLAETAGMSRSAFALRFKELVGEAPLEYLTRWRMYKASRLLREGDRKLLDVANAIGYDSDGAFNRAFKRVIGVAPGEFRRNVPLPVTAQQTLAAERATA